VRERKPRCSLIIWLLCKKKGSDRNWMMIQQDACQLYIEQKDQRWLGPKEQETWLSG
jgi:hypothetical protein